MPKSVGIAVAIALGIKGALYLLAAWRWSRERKDAQALLRPRRDHG